MKKSHVTNKDTQAQIKSETISELAHRHAHDPNHTTTDEELRNARIEINEDDGTSSEELSELADADNSTVLPPLPFEKDSDTTDGEVSGSDTKPNPYNILK